MVVWAKRKVWRTTMFKQKTNQGLDVPLWHKDTAILFTGLLVKCGFWLRVHDKHRWSNTMTRTTLMLLLANATWRRVTQLFLLSLYRNTREEWHQDSMTPPAWCQTQICYCWQKTWWSRWETVSIATVQSGPEQCRRLWTCEGGAYNLSSIFHDLSPWPIRPWYKIKTNGTPVCTLRLHPLCPLLVESVLSGPGGRWRWTALWWSIPGRSLGRSSCTSPSSLWTAPTWGGGGGLQVEKQAMSSVIGCESVM